MNRKYILLLALLIILPLTSCASDGAAEASFAKGVKFVGTCIQMNTYDNSLNNCKEVYASDTLYKQMLSIHKESCAFQGQSWKRASCAKIGQARGACQVKYKYQDQVTSGHIEYYYSDENSIDILKETCATYGAIPSVESSWR